MDIHRAGLDIDVSAPDRIEQLFTAEHPARVAHQMVEQAEFRRAQMHLTLAPLHSVGDAVQQDIAVTHYVLG